MRHARACVFRRYDVVWLVSSFARLVLKAWPNDRAIIEACAGRLALAVCP